MLDFDVSYYNETHRQLLADTAIADELDRLVKNGLQLKEAEYWAYSVFKHQKDKGEWRTYKQLRRKLPKFRPAYREYFDTKRKTVQSVFSGTDTDRATTEAMAVGASLGLMSEALGLHEADWEKIDESKKKDLDFQIAATRRSIYELESKGAVSDDDGVSSISGKRAEIEAKKKDQRKGGNKNQLVGIITKFPTSKLKKTHCYLLDPPSFAGAINPIKHKLLARLLFYLREINMVLAARFLIALANRINDLGHIDDFGALDGKPLIDSDGDPFNVPESASTVRSIDRPRRFFGEVFPFSDTTWFFYGFDFTLLEMLIAMRHQDILDFKSALPGQLPEKVVILGRLHLRDMRRMGLPPNAGRKTPDPNRREIELVGELYANNAGRVFGELKVKAQ